MPSWSALLVARLASAAQLVAARRDGGFEAAKAIVDTGLPNEEMASLRVVLKGLEAEEEQLLRERLADHEWRVRWFWAGMAAWSCCSWAGRALPAGSAPPRSPPGAARKRTPVSSDDEQRVEYAIVMLDLEGRVATWNAGAERISGYQRKRSWARLRVLYVPEDIGQDKPMRTLQPRPPRAGSEEGWLARRDGSASGRAWS